MANEDVPRFWETGMAAATSGRVRVRYCAPRWYQTPNVGHAIAALSERYRHECIGKHRTRPVANTRNVRAKTKTVETR